ncbi:MAG TPA: hypothetical protein PKH10_04860 [bacterium]|nr:hypothetical protein [bacterium]
MIPREVAPGVIILISEEDAWREFLFGIPAPNPLSSKSGHIVVKPGDNALSLVPDLAVPKEAFCQEKH